MRRSSRLAARQPHAAGPAAPSSPATPPKRAKLAPPPEPAASGSAPGSSPSPSDWDSEEAEHSSEKTAERRDGRVKGKLALLYRVGELPHADNDLPPPSAELLRTIHHSASALYAERGEMLNLLHERNLLDREGGKAKEGRGPPAPGPEETSARQRGQMGQRVDMYRAMDGGALLALGMILQEHVRGELTGVARGEEGDGR